MKGNYKWMDIKRRHSYGKCNEFTIHTLIVDGKMLGYILRDEWNKDSETYTAYKGNANFAYTFGRSTNTLVEAENKLLEEFELPANKQKEGRMLDEIPNPGSDEAIKMGCICAVLDNRHGKGAFDSPDGMFWITAGCLLHDPQNHLAHPNKDSKEG